MGRRRAQVFVKEGVVLFGFLNGVFLSLGVNPGAELLGVVAGFAQRVASGSAVSFLVAVLPLVLLAAMLVVIFRRGGWMGLLAVSLAFLAGVVLLADAALSLLLLLAALALGYVAAR